MTPERDKSKRWRPRVSIKGLLVITAFCAVLVAWWMDHAALERMTDDLLRKSKGSEKKSAGYLVDQKKLELINRLASLQLRKSRWELDRLRRLDEGRSLEGRTLDRGLDREPDFSDREIQRLRAQLESDYDPGTARFRSQ